MKVVQGSVGCGKANAACDGSSKRASTREVLNSGCTDDVRSKRESKIYKELVGKKKTRTIIVQRKMTGRLLGFEIGASSSGDWGLRSSRSVNWVKPGKVNRTRVRKTSGQRTEGVSRSGILVQ